VKITLLCSKTPHNTEIIEYIASGGSLFLPDYSFFRSASLKKLGFCANLCSELQETESNYVYNLRTMENTDTEIVQEL